MNKQIITEVHDAISMLVKAKEILRDLDVLRSERTTGEFGEWFAETLLNAKRATSTSQSGWDLIDSQSVKYQIKTHAKGAKNKARWTEWKYSDKKFDCIIILVFSTELRLKEAYNIPFNVAINRINFKQKQIVLKWDDFSDFIITDLVKSHADLKIFLL